MPTELGDEETARLAQGLAALTGETVADAVRKALAERLARERRRRTADPALAQRFMEIGAHCAALPDHGASAELYDETGMWR